MGVFKKIAYLIFVFAISCGMKPHQKNLILISLSGASLNYEIKNIGSEKIFIPMNYRIRKSNDTIILEAYYKSSLIDYNKFIVPQMQLLPMGSSLEGTVNISDKLKADYNYFFRIFDEDPQTYMSENGINVMSELTFIRYENSSSQLIKANWK